MDSQVWKAGKERSWSWVRFVVSVMGTAGELLGKVKVDIVVLNVRPIRWRVM